MTIFTEVSPHTFLPIGAQTNAPDLHHQRVDDTTTSARADGNMERRRGDGLPAAAVRQMLAADQGPLVPRGDGVDLSANWDGEHGMDTAAVLLSEVPGRMGRIAGRRNVRSPRGTAVMPRTTKATPADTLEHQAAADSDLEELPDFTMPGPNGHTPEGVRPSERCGTPSTHGWNHGMGCTLVAFHPGNHSWDGGSEVLSDELAQLRQQDEAEEEFDPERSVMSDDERWDGSVQKSYRLADGTPCDEHGKPLTQPALPGTPEPEFNEYSVPVESAFNEQDFQSAPGLRAIAEAWISETEELAHLRGITIRYFWKRRGGLKGGNPRLGNMQKPSGIARYSLGHPTLWMWLAADHCRDLKLDHDQIRAAVLHELCKASTDPDDHSAYRVVGPDAEVFVLEIQKVGLWSLDLREVGAHVKQLGLLDTLTLEPDQAA